MAKNTQVVKLKAQVKELKADLKSANKSRKAWFKLATKAGGLLAKLVQPEKAAKRPVKKAVKKAAKKTKAAEEE